MSKVIIVTGASSGIGAVVAQHLDRLGYSLALNGRNEQRLEQVAKSLEPNRVLWVAGDVSKAQDRKTLVHKTLERFGRIDGLINNAGVFWTKPFLDVTEEELDTFVVNNLKSTFFLTQAVVPELIKVGGGAIVNIGTVLVKHAIAGAPASAPMTTKGGIHALTKQLAAEFGSQQIRVNTVAPGIIRTPMHQNNGIEDTNSLAGLHLLQKVGEPHHIASTIQLLIENDFITGTIVDVDGGHVAGHHL